MKHSADIQAAIDHEKRIKEDQRRQAVDPTYKYAALTGDAVTNADAEPKTVNNDELGPVIVYKLSTGTNPFYLGLPVRSEAGDVQADEELEMIEPGDKEVVSRLQTFPFGQSSVPNDRWGANWIIDQLGNGELQPRLLLRGEVLTDPESKTFVMEAATEILGGVTI